MSDRVKVICVQGKQPDEHKARDTAARVAVRRGVQFVRAGVPDEVIYATITDPRFGISASVLDKSEPGKYAIKQIENAHNEAALPDWLLKMNSEYAYIGQVGGRQRILWQDGKRNIFMTKGDVKEFLVNRPYVKVPRVGWHRGQNRAVRGMASHRRIVASMTRSSLHRALRCLPTSTIHGSAGRSLHRRKPRAVPNSLSSSGYHL